MHQIKQNITVWWGPKYAFDMPIAYCVVRDFLIYMAKYTNHFLKYFSLILKHFVVFTFSIELLSVRGPFLSSVFNLILRAW